MAAQAFVGGSCGHVFPQGCFRPTRYNVILDFLALGLSVRVCRNDDPPYRALFNVNRLMYQPAK